MSTTLRISRIKNAIIVALALYSAVVMAAPRQVCAQTAPEPVVAIHFSELTQALETMPARTPTPRGQGTTGYEWWVTEWHYFVGPESLEEALRSDGTPFVEVSDADIAAGNLVHPDGSPKYPILISLASEAIDDSGLAPLRAYVDAGGILFVGSSSFTRNPDGTTRGDFALASEMGMHMVHPMLQNWYKNLRFSKVVDHRIAADIPSGTLSWRMPFSSDEIPLGTALNHSIHGYHDVFQVYAGSGTTVIANGDSGPLLTTRQYGMGNFIYHGAMQPLIGHTVYDPSLYAYLIYRRAIEWAFEAADLPIIKLSPWQYEYDAAYIIRHDFENDPVSIRSIERSADFEQSHGAKGSYYFCTGTLRDEMADKNSVVASLRKAVTKSGATIGSHNGGLKNPVASLPISSLDYWHWGPDEVLDITPPGYASGRAYAQASMSLSFQDMEGWLAGVDNGRAGCGAAGNCPRTWVSPYFNSAREGSYGIVEDLGAVVSMGEQKIGPFPHWTMSYETRGQRFSHISIPASDWYVGAEIPGAIEWGHTINSMKAAVDFYYNLGASIELYGHIASVDGNVMGEYVKYCAAKPRMWAADPVGISDWWQDRTNIMVAPSYSITDNTVTARAAITGAVANSAIEVAIPGWNSQGVSNIQVFINDAPADPADYRTVGNRIKVRTGASTSSAKVQYTLNTVNNPVPTTDGLNPTSTTAGSPGFTLSVTGSGFINGSLVQWNGSSRATTYGSATQVTAVIPAADIATAGTATVTVFTPAPGGGTSNARTFTINVSPSGTWTQTDWAGGAGQPVWADTTRYGSASGIDAGVAGRISLASTSPILFSDDFTRQSGGTLSPWVVSMGTWTAAGGVLQGTGSANQYSYASFTPTSQWTDYTLQGRIQMPAGSFGGGIGGRTNASTGAHYGAWVYPAGSPGGSNLLKLWKFRGWTDVGAGVPMQQVSLPDVGTGWHMLKMTFVANRIQVYYDGVLMIDVNDNNYDARAPYLSGGISADWWTWSLPYTLSVDDISVVALTTYDSSGALFSSAFDGGNGVQWQTVSWDATAGPGTDVCVRTRTADTSEQLADAAWSNCYAAIGSAVMSGNWRWIQYQLELATSDTSTAPVFNEIRTSYLSGIPGAAVPVISGLTPTSGTAGSSAFTLTVSGTGFINGSEVQWNGSNRSTTYVSANQLTAAIPAADMASAGTATVTVFTPSPGGGTSNALTFTVTGIASGSANSLGNNFTLLMPSGIILGGTNDVKFTWDGSLQNTAAFANGNGPSNATISSDEPLYGWLWYARNVQVVGPGTYWVDLDGAGPSTNRYEVTIPAGRIGAHLLLDWGETDQPTSCAKTDCDIDVWMAWDLNNAFMTGKLFTGADDGISTNAPASDDPPVNSSLDGRLNVSTKAWDLVSVDLAGRITSSAGTTITDLPLDGIPGIMIREGSYYSANVNFNLMMEDLCADAATRCSDNNACTSDKCDPLTGACANITIICNDSNLCTTDTCNIVTGCVYTPKDCNDNNVCTGDYCNMKGQCVHPNIICNDTNVCTTDSCSQAAGGCVFTNNTVACTDNNGCTVNDVCSGGACVPGIAKVCPLGDVCDPASGCNVLDANTSGNNMTMVIPTGLVIGGTNDVKFTWDGTVQNAATFANGTGPSNATIRSDEPLSNWLWYARNVQVVGPGTYWVDLDGAGPSLYRYEVTIPANRIGAHMLLDWGETGHATSCGKINCDVDVWVAWDYNNAFMTGKLFTGADDGTNTTAPAWDDPPVDSVTDGSPNAGTTVWDLVSVDFAGRVITPSGALIRNLPLDNVPGMRMQEGDYNGAGFSFNVKAQ